MTARIVIVGISGTGKSACGKYLAESALLPLHHMDAIIWGSHWIETPEDRIRSALSGISSSEKWIVEGWVDTYSTDIIQQSDIVLYLDYPGWLAALGGVQRWWAYKGKKRPEMPEGCTEGFDLGFLRDMLLRKERPHIESVLAQMRPLNVIRVRSRRETGRFLAELALTIRKSAEDQDE